MKELPAFSSVSVNICGCKVLEIMCNHFCKKLFLKNEEKLVGKIALKESGRFN